MDLNHPNCVPVDMIDLDTGEVIETFKSIKEASFKTGINATSISYVCMGMNHKAGGYGWRKNFNQVTAENISKEKSPVIEINEPYININYLISGLRDIQNGRYCTPECEKEYICIENVIDYLNTTASSFLHGGL